MISITTNAATKAFRWKTASSDAFVGKKILAALRRISTRVKASLIKSVSNDLLQVRSGNLKKAIFADVVETADGAELSAGVDLQKAPYGRIQDVGGIVRPKRAKFLTIPLSPNLRGNGVMRVDARTFIANPGSLGFTGSFVTREKTAIMGTRRDGTVEPVFALVKSVRIKATGYIKRSLKENEKYIKEEMQTVSEEIAKEVTRDEP